MITRRVILYLSVSLSCRTGSFRMSLSLRVVPIFFYLVVVLLLPSPTPSSIVGSISNDWSETRRVWAPLSQFDLLIKRSIRHPFINRYFRLSIGVQRIDANRLNESLYKIRIGIGIRILVLLPTIRLKPSCCPCCPCSSHRHDCISVVVSIFLLLSESLVLFLSSDHMNPILDLYSVFRKLAACESTTLHSKYNELAPKRSQSNFLVVI